MKISEMVKLLNEIKDAFGDLDCWYAKDDEGTDIIQLNLTRL